MTNVTLRQAAARHITRSAAYRSAGAITQATRERSIALALISAAVLMESE